MPPRPSRPAGTPLAPPSRPLGIPLAPPDRPSRTPLAPPTRPAGTPLTLPSSPPVPPRPPPTAPLPVTLRHPPPPPTPVSQPAATASTSTSTSPPQTATAPPIPTGAIRLPPSSSAALHVGTAIPRREVHVPQVGRLGAAAAGGGMRPSSSSTTGTGAAGSSAGGVGDGAAVAAPNGTGQVETAAKGKGRKRAALTSAPAPAEGQARGGKRAKKAAVPAGTPAATSLTTATGGTTTLATTSTGTVAGQGQGGTEGEPEGRRRKSARVAARASAAPGPGGTSPEGEEEAPSSPNSDGAGGTYEPPTPPLTSRTRKGKAPASQPRPSKARGRKRKLDLLRADANGIMPGEEGYDPVSGGGDVSHLSATSPTPDGEGPGTLVVAKPRRPRLPPPSPSTFSAALLDPGPPLDPNTTLMRDILRDPGVGRVSNRWVEVYRAKRRLDEERKRERGRRREREVEERRRGEVKVRRELGLEEGGDEAEGGEAEGGEDGGEGGEAGGEGQGAAEGQAADSPPRPPTTLTRLSAIEAALRAAAEPFPPSTAEEEGDDTHFRETHTAPQLRIGLNGEWEVDEDALFIDRAEDPALQLGEGEEMEIVEERESDRFVNSYTHSRREREGRSGGKWSREETEMLCKGVGWFGFDFEMISKLFVGRGRGGVKRRWKRLEREEPERAEEAWRRREPIDLEHVSLQIGKNLLVPAAPIYRPSPAPLDVPPASGLSVQRPVPESPMPSASRKPLKLLEDQKTGLREEEEEEEFDMDVTLDPEEEGEMVTFEEVEQGDVVLGQDGEEEELPSLREAMIL